MSIIFCLFVHIKLYFLVLPVHNSTSQIGIVHILRQQSMGLYTRYPIVARRAWPSASREQRYLAYNLWGRGLEYFIELNSVEQLFKSVK